MRDNSDSRGSGVDNGGDHECSERLYGAYAAGRISDNSVTVKTDFKTRPGFCKVSRCNGSILLLYKWTMEAIMNVLKDCMEHTPPGGTVHCSYEQNPLYTQIKIWDTGAG